MDTRYVHLKSIKEFITFPTNHSPFLFTNLFFQPSLADKASKPTVKKWMNDISKAKREIKSKYIISI